ncbi:flagellar export protein FliJ [Ammoniphilus oxalaticus]|uniref:Flagellar FliJ protein n=1 Tax=Ammoniphilus oxalaticus TaxID=66863 RepID=A0A419SJJ0_9BACL|nr:flagellar export protein FliJ [Ammoniphilus oxalaticus]RKD24201.1 flagellar export protein FliJ [Ammoniphilus oxalaticus]
MTFIFPLQKVLDVKEKEKQQAQQELGFSLKKQLDIEENMNALAQRRASLESRMLQVNQGFRACELLDQQRYLTFLDEKMDRLQNNLRQTVKEVEIKQTVLSEKSVDEKVWQNWKQELRERHQQAVRKQEQDELDEIATIRFFREQRVW